MKFWNEHAMLRVCLLTAFFLGGIAAVVGGLSLSGKLSGVLVMLAGLGLLPAVLWLYNVAYTEPKSKR